MTKQFTNRIEENLQTAFQEAKKQQHIKVTENYLLKVFLEANDYFSAIFNALLN